MYQGSRWATAIRNQYFLVFVCFTVQDRKSLERSCSLNTFLAINRHDQPSTSIVDNTRVSPFPGSRSALWDGSTLRMALSATARKFPG